MDFIHSDSQRERASVSRTSLTDRLTPERLREVEAGGDRFDPGLWADLAGAGILAAALPEPLGGAGVGLLEECSVLAEIGRAVAPVPSPPPAGPAAAPAPRFGPPARQRRGPAPPAPGGPALPPPRPGASATTPRPPPPPP